MTTEPRGRTHILDRGSMISDLRSMQFFIHSSSLFTKITNHNNQSRLSHKHERTEDHCIGQGRRIVEYRRSSNIKLRGETIPSLHLRPTHHSLPRNP